jgi:hypothetical protein
MQVSHDSDHMPDSGRMPDSSHMLDSDWMTWLWSYARLQSKAATPVICVTPVERRDSGCIPDSGWKIWLRFEDTTLDVYPDSSRHFDSDHISQLRSHFPSLVVSHDSVDTPRLQSYIVWHVLPTHLWKTLHGRARWLQYLTPRSLCWKQTELERMTRPAFETSASHSFACSRVKPMDCVTSEHLASFDLRESWVS